MKPPKLWPRTLQRSTPSSRRMCSASRTIESARKCVRYVGLVLRCLAGDLRSDRRRAARPTLIEEEDPVVLDGPLHPAGRRARRPGRFDPGAALEEEEIRARRAVRRGDLAREDGDPRPLRPPVVERDGVLALGQDRAGHTVGRGHRFTSSCGFVVSIRISTLPIPGPALMVLPSAVVVQGGRVPTGGAAGRRRLDAPRLTDRTPWCNRVSVDRPSPEPGPRG